ncbi:MAG: sulfite exporter TauE/SafE family protein [Polyangiaceae bacterium]
MTIAAALSSALLMGVVGSSHCTLMCGGLVGLASSAPVGKAPSLTRTQLQRHIASHAGRIVSYAMAGAVVGATGGGLKAVLGSDRLPWALRLVAGAVMILVGLHLAGFPGAIRVLEWPGHLLWRRISGLALRVAAARSTSAAFAFGLLWGWLPCGLVYAALALAGTTGSAPSGALAMVAFGVGTFPMLAMVGVTGAIVTRHTRARWVRLVAAAAMLVLGAVQIEAAGRSMVASASAPACHHPT